MLDYSAILQRIPNLTLNDVQKLALVMGITLPDAETAYPTSTQVMDPISFPWQVGAGALAIGAAPTDLTTFEQIPANISSTEGAFSSRGQTAAMAGPIYGVSLIVRPSVAATALTDFDKVVNAYEIVLKSSGNYRVIPFVEALRVVPGVSVATTTATTDMRQPTGCPTGGKPQYVLPGCILPWTGDRDSLIGIRCNSTLSSSTTTAAVNGTLVVWSALAVGKAADGSKGFSADGDCAPQTLRGMVARALFSRQLLALMR